MAVVAPIATQATAAPIFQTSFRWMVVIGLNLSFPPLFVPLYEAVSFLHPLPASTAQAAGAQHGRPKALVGPPS